MDVFSLAVGLFSGFLFGIVLCTVYRSRSNRSDLNPDVSVALSQASSQLGQQLQAGQFVLERERTAVSSEVAAVKTELSRMSELVSSLRSERLAQSAKFDSTLNHAFKVSNNLAKTTEQLSNALASPGARGQWGERMAEDVLVSAGFVEGINFVKHKKMVSGGIPDYTFLMPKGSELNMDVKFPITNYLRFLEAASDSDRTLSVKKFKSDVRQRVQEIADRDYISPGTTLHYVLLFVPNESVYGFLHQHDSDLIDFSLKRKVILCSPTSLFAVLAVVRQSVDNYLVSKQSDEILNTVERLKIEWAKFIEPIEKMGRGLESAQKAFDELSGQRVRQFQKEVDSLSLSKSENVHQAVIPDLEPSFPATTGKLYLADRDSASSAE